MELVSVLGTWRALLAAPPYSLTESPEPWTFDSKPPATIDAAFCVQSRLREAEGGLNYLQDELHEVIIFLAERVGRNPRAAWAALQSSCASLCSTIAHDINDGSYQATVIEYDVPEPGPEDEHVSARVVIDLDLERVI